MEVHFIYVHNSFWIRNSDAFATHLCFLFFCDFIRFYLLRLIIICMLNWHFAFVAAPSDGKRAEHKEDGLSVDVKLPVKHVLSRDLQVCWTIYFSFYVRNIFERLCAMNDINRLFWLLCSFTLRKLWSLL